ncbi:glycosyltransferase family 4 protein [Microbacterium sp. SSM24]|uniref:glycosyltransferase family 4 protein n=1 Tax=Microbacterium sp. SSM24 TaxID=2991714 RepID=UPI002225E7AC|nr:glycosyltransferase family 4 protein [Microbacterium sp. SSM24]MCW3492768.1 glycosyltransferase family 4 protein [Microbacterium sp. SSM24]
MTSSTVLVAHPGSELYGSDRVLLDSVIGLVHSGERVVVTLPEGGPLQDALHAAGAEVVVAPAFVLRKRLMRPAGWGELVRTGWNGARAAWTLLSGTRPATLYVSTITLPLWPLLGRLRRVPVVLHVHEGEASAGRLTKAVLYAPALAANRILVNSSFSSAVMTSTYGRLGSRAEVVLNAVPGPPSPSAPREEISDGLRVLFVGRLSPRKGADLAVEAVRLLDERGIRTTLDIVGSTFEGYEPYEESLREAIESSGLGDRVTLHGFQTDIWGFLDRADVLVVPSRLDEPFGNTAVEGILAARPVIASDTSGLREATDGIRTAWRVTPDSASAIADALVDVAERWPDVRGQVEESRSIAAERHSPQRYQTRVAELVTNPTGRR